MRIKKTGVMLLVSITLVLFIFIAFIDAKKEVPIQEIVPLEEQKQMDSQIQFDNQIEVVVEENSSEELYSEELYSEEAQPDEILPDATLEDESEDSSPVEELLAELTLEEKVAQLFVLTPEALTGVETATAAGDSTRQALETYPVGGLVYFAKNLVTPEQTKEMLSNTQTYATGRCGFPIFLAVDEEGGRVTRIGRNEVFGVDKPDAMGVLAQEGDIGVIEETGEYIGTYLSELGFNLDFAPDADVLTNPENQVIGDRSFGADSETVADMAQAFSRGLNRVGVWATYKHFPGHGDTAEDSHTGYAYSYKTLEEMQSADLIPFQKGSEQGVDFIMVGHISTPNVTNDDVPSSLSSYWITDVLREEMGYQGIVITDSLAMGAITNHYTSGEVVIQAVQAGCDMLLMPSNFKEAYQALLDAVDEGVISEERIDASVRRILTTKCTRGGTYEE